MDLILVKKQAAHKRITGRLVSLRERLTAKKIEYGQAVRTPRYAPDIASPVLVRWSGDRASRGRGARLAYKLEALDLDLRLARVSTHRLISLLTGELLNRGGSPSAD